MQAEKGRWELGQGALAYSQVSPQKQGFFQREGKVFSSWRSVLSLKIEGLRVVIFNFFFLEKLVYDHLEGPSFLNPFVCGTDKKNFKWLCQYYSDALVSSIVGSPLGKKIGQKKDSFLVQTREGFAFDSKKQPSSGDFYKKIIKNVIFNFAPVYLFFMLGTFVQKKIATIFRTKEGVFWLKVGAHLLFQHKLERLLYLFAKASYKKAKIIFLYYK